MAENDARTPKSHGRKSISASLQPQELMTDNPRLAGVWEAVVITLLPQAFPGTLGESLTGRALKNGLWALRTVDLREFGEGRHRNVDDTPAGGGAGMVLRPDVVGRALDAARSGAPKNRPVIYLSPCGKPFSQAMARNLTDAPGVTLICGRFEGLDQRVIDHYGVTEVSLGDFVLTGGEIAAQALIDAVVRLIPGVLGNETSPDDESFSAGLLEHPQYTRPAEWKGMPIPPVLLSGNHAKIDAWRKDEAKRLTQTRRPDLWNLWLKEHGDKTDD